MLFELLIALSIGIIFGTFTGLSPGIHINLVAAFLVSISSILLRFTEPIYLVVFIVAMGIAHTFIDFIPSIFLGAPEEDTALSILPAHQLLIEGRGYEAVKLSSYGSLFAIPVIIILLPIFIFLLQEVEDTLILVIPYILIISTIFIILKDKNKLNSLIVFILSGFLGIAALNSAIKDPLLPMLTGLFGLSSLIVSLKLKSKIPLQQTKIKINKRELISPALASFIYAPLCSVIPGVGSSQAATLSSTLIESTNKKFIVLLGATNTIVLGLSFVVLYSISKSRTGVAAITNQIIPNITFNNLLIILAVIIFSGIISFFIALFIGKLFAVNISKINYQKLSIGVIIFLSIITLLISSLTGLFLLLVSTILGLYCLNSGVKRINLMGCLVLPTIIIYLI